MGYMFMPDKTAETIDEDGKRPHPLQEEPESPAMPCAPP
jgi:hypothetical protein